MYELAKAYKEIGRLEFEKESVLKSVRLLIVEMESNESTGSKTSTALIHGYLSSILSPYKKEE